jgi:hypothetical protein
MVNKMNPMVDVYVKAIKSGRLTIDNVPRRYKEAVEQELAKE